MLILLSVPYIKRFSLYRPLRSTSAAQSPYSLPHALASTEVLMFPEGIQIQHVLVLNYFVIYISLCVT